VQEKRTSTKITVLVPTYRRPDSLRRCIDGILSQIRPADEILVIAQRSDEETVRLFEILPQSPVLKLLRKNDGGGVVGQLNAGIDASQGDLIAITDDDAVPRPDWLMRIEADFSGEADLGGVGGRDYIYDTGVEMFNSNRPVGTVQWFGRITGDHHLGAQRLHSIDSLKGVNMSYRRIAIGGFRFDPELRGNGAQNWNELAFSLGIQKRGWRLLFDPEVLVDHYPAPRVHSEGRVGPSLEATENSAFNFYLSLFRHMRPGVRRLMALCWSRFVGARHSPGILLGFASRLKGDQQGVALRRAAARAWHDAAKMK
jgi:glycosyltransferase involved in cell wall biosynthesis